MQIQFINAVIFIIVWMTIDVFSTNEARNNHPAIDYCQNESFQPRCLKNEVIFLRSATYGRMQIGRCITDEEVAALVPHFGKNPPNLGCSADVLSFLDRNCFAKRECEVRVVDISATNLKPCFPILNVYLEVTYDCISVVDEDRSCFVTASRDPIHIISSSKKTCGTESNPWHIEASSGQTINITLLESAKTTSSFADGHLSKEKFCQGRGFIIDKAGNRNTTICGDGGGGEGSNRENNLHLSTGNTVDIIIIPTSEHPHSTDDADSSSSFIFKLEAVGCSNIIPPEDAWLQRKDDAVVIGCFSNRQTWHLNCQRGKWIGVLGNCSQDGAEVSVVEPRPSPVLSTNGQVLAIVAICGFTLAICLAIVCIGAVCLRRLYGRMKKRDLHYKTFTCSHPVDSAARSQFTDRPIPAGYAACSKFPGDDIRGFDMQPATLHLVNDGQADFSVSSHGVEDNAIQTA